MIEQLLHRFLKVPYVLSVRTIKRAKKPRATVLLIHGIGNSGAEWDEVIAKMPSDISVYVIDLLGFGESPKPKWAQYNATTQARSVIATLLKLWPRQRLILVGHSLGALVAIEVARRYPLLVQSLVLCSPPLYAPNTAKRIPNNDEVLRRIYRRLEKYPEELIRLSPIAVRYKIVNKAYNVTTDNVDSYLATLKSSIINQTSYQDIARIKRPITLMYGTFDPLVIGRNFKKAAKLNPSINLVAMLLGHEITKKYAQRIVREVTEHANKTYK